MNASLKIFTVTLVLCSLAHAQIPPGTAVLLLAGVLFLHRR